MFAVIKTGGKQYKVAVGDVIKIERLTEEPGKDVRFEEVLMLGGDKPAVGTPLVKGAAVVGKLLEQGRARKIMVFKKRRRQNSRRRNGHRQPFSLVEITEILADGKSSNPPAPAKAKPSAAKSDEVNKDAKEEAAKAKKPAVKKPAAKKPAEKAEKKD